MVQTIAKLEIIANAIKIILQQQMFSLEFIMEAESLNV